MNDSAVADRRGAPIPSYKFDTNLICENVGRQFLRGSVAPQSEVARIVRGLAESPPGDERVGGGVIVGSVLE